MKIIVSIFLIAISAFALGIYLPWWSLALAAFIVSVFFVQKPGWAFISGFIAIFLLWGVLTWITSSANGNLFAHRISKLILKTDNPSMLILVTSLIGALVGGFAALSGSLFRRILAK